MCGRYTLSTPGDEIAEVFGLSGRLEIEPRFNIAPSQMAPIVCQGDGIERVVKLCRWGLVPYWAKDISIGARLINARAETVAETPAYRTSFERRRCLVVADGFYEWRREGRHRRPFFFSLPSAAPFAIAGLFDRWRHGGVTLESFTLVTTGANEDVVEVHDRMPVILPLETWPIWLDRADSGSPAVHALLHPAAPGVLAARPVSTFVNSPANDSPRCVEAMEPVAAGDAQSHLF